MRTAVMHFRCGTFEFKVGGHIVGSAEYRLNQALHDHIAGTKQRFTGASRWAASMSLDRHSGPNPSRADLLEAA